MLHRKQPSSRHIIRVLIVMLIRFLLGEHPSESAKEVSSVKQLWGGFVDQPGFTVVIPCTHTPGNYQGDKSECDPMIEHLTKEICPALGEAEWQRSTQRNLEKSRDRPPQQSPEVSLLVLEIFNSRS